MISVRPVARPGCLANQSLYPITLCYVIFLYLIVILYFSYISPSDSPTVIQAYVGESGYLAPVPTLNQKGVSVVASTGIQPNQLERVSGRADHDAQGNLVHRPDHDGRVITGQYGAVYWGGLQAPVIISILPCLLDYLLLQRYTPKAVCRER